MMLLAGYLDRISARPGEAVEVKVSSQLGAPYDVDLVRIICADPNPAGPGLRMNPVPDALGGRYPGRNQPIRAGSYASAPTPGLYLPDPCTVTVRVQPGLLATGPRPVLAIGATVLTAGPDGAALSVGGVPVCTVRAPMRDRCWYGLRAVFAGGMVRLRQTALQRTWGLLDSGEAEGRALPPAGEQVLIASDGTTQFDGRIEDPRCPAPIEWLFRTSCGCNEFPLPSLSANTSGFGERR